jgi:hypothetical protein
MATTAGVITVVSVGSTTASLSSAAATGGTGPYTYQWYRSVTTGFTIGAGSLIAGATSLTINDSGLIPSTQYFYKLVSTDSGAVSATSAQSTLTTLIATMSQNALQMSPFIGMVDLKNMGDVVAVQVDASQASPILPGQALKIVASAGGLPKVVSCSANSDQCIGFANYDLKSTGYAAGDKLEMSTSDSVIYLYATTAIPRFARVTLDVSSPGAVGVLVGSSGASIVGYAFDQGVIGNLIRVKLTCPTFAVA